MAVRIEESVVKAMAGKPRRSLTNRPTNSAARCCASAALPPLPQKSNLPPDWRQLEINDAASTIAAPHSRATLLRSWAPSWKQEVTRFNAVSVFIEVLISGYKLSARCNKVFSMLYMNLSQERKVPIRSLGKRAWA